MTTLAITTTRHWLLVQAFALLGRLASFVAPDRRGNTRWALAYHSSARNCVLVLDASGSMLCEDWTPSRMGAAKEAAQSFCDRLRTEQPDARIAILAFGNGCKIYCNLTRASEIAKLSEAIGRIDCLGLTNMRSGLGVARRILQRCDKTECQVVLLTDGHNTGACPRKFAAQLRKFAVVECVGIGGSPVDVDEFLLKQISSAYPDGSKRYRWIGDKEKLVEHFHNLAGGISRS